MMSEQSPLLEAFLQNTFEDIENKMKGMISDERILSILNGGKRLRPLLGAIAFKVCTGGKEPPEKYQKFLEGCVGVELAPWFSILANLNNTVPPPILADAVDVHKDLEHGGQKT